MRSFLDPWGGGGGGGSPRVVALTSTSPPLEKQQPDLSSWIVYIYLYKKKINYIEYCNFRCFFWNLNKKYYHI